MLVALEGGKPHEPVQPVVVRRDETRGSGHVARLAFELVVQPFGSVIVRVRAIRALENNLRAILGDGAESSVGIHDPIEKIENILHIK